MQQDAHKFFQDWLDRWADCFLADDRETFCSMSELPLSLRSNGAEWVVTNREELEFGFNRYRQMMLGADVDLVVRALRNVEELPENGVKLLYENYLMKGANRMFRPSGAEAYLRRTGNDWKAYRVIEIEIDDPAYAHLPATRADKLHDAAVLDRLTNLRPADDAPAKEKDNG